MMLRRSPRECVLMRWNPAKCEADARMEDSLWRIMRLAVGKKSAFRCVLLVIDIVFVVAV
jgi:hypothetical protein